MLLVLQMLKFAAPVYSQCLKVHDLTMRDVYIIEKIYLAIQI